MAKQSLYLIEATAVIAEKAKPITGRGVGYKLFTGGLIPSMETKSMQRVYRLLNEARELGIIPWSWIVDETRDLDPDFTNPEEFISLASRSYHRNLWTDQPRRVEVWSEKGTARFSMGMASGSARCMDSAERPRSTM
jgi:hypothetical protein